MSRCQHNQRITKFCTTPTCTHPSAGGCEYCFKRYHCHIADMKFLKENQVNDLIKYLTAFQDKKIKVRPLKEAIYNYFNVIKGQISTYLDCLSSDLLNRITYPYIRKQGNLNIIKKLKHKEYNKLTTQQMIKIADFKESNNPEKLQKNEILSYLEESQQVYKKVCAIHTIYKQLQKQTEQSYLGQSIMSVSIFYKKIADIYEHIENQKKPLIKKLDEAIIKKQFTLQLNKDKKISQSQKNSTQKPMSQRKNEVSFSNNTTKVSEEQSAESNKIKNIQNYTSETSGLVKKSSNNQQNNEKQTRPRKVSIDSRCSDLLVRSRLKTKTYEEKQKQITQRKQKLQEMMNKSDKKNQLHKRQSSSSSNSSENRKKFIQQNFNSLNQKSVTDSQKFKQNSNGRTQMFAHTLLPQGKQQKKLYQQQVTVQKKTLRIPVNVIPQNAEDEQCQSPILRLKKSQKHKTGHGSSGFQLGVFKVQHSACEQTHSQPIDRVTETPSQSSSEASDKQNVKPQPLSQSQDLSITQKQANSLFLFVESLKLSAKKAVALLEASLKYAPNNFSAAQYLSYLYLDLNKPKQCLKVCNQALNLVEGQPSSAQISFHLYNNKAAALNLLGRFSQSIPLLQKCIQIKKKDILFKNLGDAYSNLGIIQKAIVNYQNAVVMNEDNHQALYNLAVCYYLQKNFDASKLKVQRAMMIEKDNDSYIDLYKQINNMIGPLRK